MPALPANIQRATRAARTVTRVDATVQAAFPGARDGIDPVQPGLFESAADAAAALDLAAALMGAHRRRFAVDLADEVWIDPVVGVPTCRLIDPETEVDGAALVTRVIVDMERERTTIEVLV